MSHLLLAAYLILIASIPGYSQNSVSNNGLQPEKSDSLSGTNTLPTGFGMQLDRVMNYQFRADSLANLAAQYRRELQGNATADKSELRLKISETEKLAVINQKMAGEVLSTGIRSDTLPKEKTEIQKQKSLQTNSLFEIIQKPVYAADDKIAVNPEAPAGLIYRIQVAVFKNPAAPSYFKGITPVQGFKVVGSDLTNYYAGMFRKLSDASKALTKVKASGFKDAFVVALLDKKIISSERADVLEKEWGNIPLVPAAVSQVQEAQKDTVPPTLVFRVEVTRSQKPLSNEQLDVIRKLAGNRGLDVIKNASGQNIYLIGKFLTFESAAEYTDLLTRNGQKDAKVAAYLGRREIPVETAKQLFENFE